ncbi:hypothetical protein ZWY2020_043339 [Hordeum vulgare]|nr:hypothetical protein ZWY2020_043339 [Hordeum vulgare]
MILANTEESSEAHRDSHLIPATMAGQKFGDKIKHYVKTDPSPTATIVFHGTVIGKSSSAPCVAAFSSRGPQYRTAEILKPDVTAPGVNILAAWTGEASPTDLEMDPRHVPFNIISGTSMSCPPRPRRAAPAHSGASGGQVGAHDHVQPDNSGRSSRTPPRDPIDAVRRMARTWTNSAQPGLVYDANTADYIGFICLRLHAISDRPSSRGGSVGRSKKPARSATSTTGLHGRLLVVQGLRHLPRVSSNVGSAATRSTRPRWRAPPAWSPR